MKPSRWVSLTLGFFILPAHVYAGESQKYEDYVRRSEQAEQWVFEDLPRHVVGDVRETFVNPWHLAALTSGAVAIVAVHQFDEDIRSRFQPDQPLGQTTDKILGIVFHPVVLGGGFLTTLAISKVVKADKVAVTAGTLLEALAVTEVLTLGLKFAVQRGRPDSSSSLSFPSAHASAAFASASVVHVLHGPQVGIPSYMLASLIGVSRIDHDKHWASDVAAGALLGTLFGLGTAKFHKDEFSSFFLAPQINQQGAGLCVIHPF